MVETPQKNYTPKRVLTQAEVRRIISLRKGGHLVNNIAQGMNLEIQTVVIIVRGELYPEFSAPIFARLVFPIE